MTGLEFLNNHKLYDGYETEEIKQDVIQMMIDFAKYHVEQALKAALEEAPTGSSTDIPSYEDMKDAILNAYPLENII